MPPRLPRPALFLLTAALGVLLPTAVPAAEPVHALFIGNSFTARHNLPNLVTRFAAAGQPSAAIKTTAVIYGGHILKEHWQLHSQDWVRLSELTAAELEQSLTELRAAPAPASKRPSFSSAIQRHEALRPALAQPRPRWNYVVLQSYRDAGAGEKSTYFEYARRFAALVRAQGATPIFYDTAPESQNARPLTEPPDRAPAELRARMVARLAAEFDGLAIPMPLVAWHCQTARPQVPLRYVNDAHLNQTMAYLTAATFYAVMFRRSPEGLPIGDVTDTKVTDRKHPDRDPDGAPLRKVFSDDERLFLQRTVARALDDFRKIAGR